MSHSPDNSRGFQVCLVLHSLSEEVLLHQVERVEAVKQRRCACETAQTKEAAFSYANDTLRQLLSGMKFGSASWNSMAEEEDIPDSPTSFLASTCSPVRWAACTAVKATTLSCAIFWGRNRNPTYSVAWRTLMGVAQEPGPILEEGQRNWWQASQSCRVRNT